MQIQKHRDVPYVNQVLENVGTPHRFTRLWSAGQHSRLEPDHDHTTEVYASSAATVAASTAMSIAVIAPMVTVVVIIMASVLTAPIGGFVVAASIVASIVVSIVASIIPCSTSIGRPIRRVTVMVAFRILSTPSSIRLLGRDKTGNKQGNSQDRNELENLHKNPLSLVRSITF